MPLQCPRCQIAQADENKTCINCGEPLRAKAVPRPAGQETPAVAEDDAHRGTSGAADAVAVRPLPWKLAALVLAGVLLALCGAALRVAHRPPVVSAARPAPAPPVPAPDAPPPPLTITLASTSEGKHLQVGSGVTFTAFTTVPHGQSATLTVFYRRDQGRKTILAFSQGSLCSTTWSPPGPGRYEFGALALDERRRAAASRPVEVVVDAPAPPKAAQASPPRPAAVAAVPRAAPPVRAASFPVPRRPRPVVLRSATQRPARPRAFHPRFYRIKAAPPPPVYYVAAARFPFYRNAAVLALALRGRGYAAVARRVSGSHGKAAYQVETGAYRRPDEAHQAAVALQRSGYPAYSYTGH